MLLRLKVDGFKNLMGVDVRFGPFTCIAGPNGVGKSNLFDAIGFLSALADQPLLKAAMSVRGEGARAADVRALFHRPQHSDPPTMSFEAEMLVPSQAVDELGQLAKATNTMLRYKLVLVCRPDQRDDPLEICHEELSHIPKGEASRHLLFDHSKSGWRDAVVIAGRRVPYFISTVGVGAETIIKRHQDGGSRGPSRSYPAGDLPRTVLSSANAAESPTMICARREMSSWRLLQLQPSNMREPDEMNAPKHLGSAGEHLASALAALAASATDPEMVYSRVANRLSELIGDVKRVWVERDAQRELLTLHATTLDEVTHSSRSLSDGTLRFLALSILEIDHTESGVICLEEPENGIHPSRIEAMIRLLTDIAMDPTEPFDDSNPLRQVIVNTHSPVVVANVDEQSLLLVEIVRVRDELLPSPSARAAFSCLPGTWRCKALPPPSVLSKGKLLSYLNPCGGLGAMPTDNGVHRRRVVDREDLQPRLF